MTALHYKICGVLLVLNDIDWYFGLRFLMNGYQSTSNYDASSEHKAKAVWII